MNEILTGGLTVLEVWIRSIIFLLVGTTFGVIAPRAGWGSWVVCIVCLLISWVGSWVLEDHKLMKENQQM